MADEKNDAKNDSTTAKANDATVVGEAGTNPEVDHDPARGYPAFEQPPAPGQDPDTLRRNQKHAAAAGIIDADEVDPPVITDGEGNRVDSDGNTVDDENDKDTKTDAAKARKAATPTRTTAPVNRSAAPTTKAAE